MIVNIDINATAEALQAPDLRRPKITALLQVLISPIIYLYDLLLIYRIAKLKERLTATIMELAHDIDSEVIDNSTERRHSCIFQNNFNNTIYVYGNDDRTIIYPQLMVNALGTGINIDNYFDYYVYLLNEPEKLIIVEKLRLPTKTFLKTYWG